MADQRMQIIAEMIDKVSPAAKRMQKSFEDLQKASAREFPTAFKKYQSAVVGNEKALVQFTKRSEGMRREIKAFQDIVARTSPTIFKLTQSIGAFTLGTGASIGAIGAIGAALIVAGKSAADFAKSMKEIKFGSAETGLGKRQLIQLIQGLGEFNIGAETTRSSFEGLNSFMTDAKGDVGELKMSIAQFGDDAGILARPIIDLIRSGKTTLEVYKAVAATLDKIDEEPGRSAADKEELKRRFVKLLRMDPDFGAVGLKALNETMEVIEKLGSTGEEVAKAADAAEKLQSKMELGYAEIDKWLILSGTFIAKYLSDINDWLDVIGPRTKTIDKLRRLFTPQFGGPTGRRSFAEGGTVIGPTAARVGDAGPEYVIPYFLGKSRRYDKPTELTLGQHGPEAVIPARANAFIRAIGRTETDFSRSEAYSDKLNKASNNKGVRQYGAAVGSDYGYYQMNQRDVAEAIRLGVPPEVAGHLAGGSQSTFATAGDVSTLEQQTGAVNELLKAKYPEKYKALVGGGSLQDATKAMGGQWEGLKKKAKAEKEFNSALSDRANLNAAMGGGVNSTGQLDVNVRAPQGTGVKAEGGGIFKDTNVRRQIQMVPSPGGPPQAPSVVQGQWPQ